MDVVLFEQRIIDWQWAKTSRQSIRNHVRDHQGKNQAVTPRHLKNNQYRRNRRPDYSSERSAHSHQCEWSNFVCMMVQDAHVQITHGPTQHPPINKAGAKIPPAPPLLYEKIVAAIFIMHSAIITRKAS